MSGFSGGGLSGVGLLSAIVNTSRNLTTVSGTQDVTGFGFNPSAAQLVFSINGGFGAGVGFVAANGAQGCSATDLTAGTTSFQSTGAAIFVSNGAGTSYQIGVVTFITDGIRITWTKSGSPTGTLGIAVLGMK